MIRRSSLWIGSVLLLTSLTGYAGGPPILTTSKVPEYFVVGRPETLVFVVRFFGGQPMIRKDYRVRATAAGLQKLDVSAIPTECRRVCGHINVARPRRLDDQSRPL